MALQRVPALVLEDGGQLRTLQQAKGAGADHDAGAQAGQVVGGGAGMVSRTAPGARSVPTLTRSSRRR